MINFHLKKKIIIQFDSVKTTTNKQPNRRWITKRTDLRYFNFVSVFRFCALYVKFFFFFLFLVFRKQNSFSNFQPTHSPSRTRKHTHFVFQCFFFFFTHSIMIFAKEKFHFLNKNYSRKIFSATFFLQKKTYWTTTNDTMKHPNRHWSMITFFLLFFP